VKDKKEEMEANIHLLEDTTKTKAQRAEENKVKTSNSFFIIILISNILQKFEEDEEKSHIDFDKPYLCNVHEDP